MNYQKIYNNLTSKDMIAPYTEKHHIIPKCMGGSDNSSNLVSLTPEVHYVVHQLLAKIYPDNDDLVYAAHMMTVDSNGQRVNNKLFGWLKRKLSNAKKGNTYGSANKGRKMENPSPMKGKSTGKDAWNKGLEMPSVSDKMKGNKNGSGIRSIEARNNMSIAQQNILPVICPYCNKTGGVQGMKRWHFDNCKSKKSPS